MSIVNLYVSTRVGQVRSARAFIAQTGKEDNILLSISALKDANLRVNIEEAAEGGFDDFEGIILPNFPASPKGLARRVSIFREMKKGLLSLLDRWEGRDVVLHLFHANTYYPYIPEILKEIKRPPVKTVMLEEGLESYKWAIAPYDLDVYGHHISAYPQWDSSRNGEIMKEACFRIGRNVGGVFKSAFNLSKAVFGFGVAGTSCLLKKDLRDELLRVKDAKMPGRFRFGIIENFDEGWFCFPDIIGKAQQISFGEIHPLELSTRELTADEKEILEELPDVMFASQRYGEYEIYYETLLRIFSEMGLKRVYIKFHPREDPAFINRYLKSACLNHPEVEVIQAPRLDSVPLESLAASGHFTQIVGLTSSSLFYVPMLSEGSSVVSCGDRFAELYPKVRKELTGTKPTPDELKQYERDLGTFHEIAGDIPQHRDN